MNIKDEYCRVIMSTVVCFCEVAYRAVKDDLPPQLHITPTGVVMKPQCPCTDFKLEFVAVTLLFSTCRSSCGCFFGDQGQNVIPSDVIDSLFTTRIRNEVSKNAQTHNSIIRCNFSCANLSSQPICSNMELDR